MQFIDADTHVYDELSIWTDYVDPRFRDRAPRFVQDGQRLMVEIGGVIFPTMPGHPGVGMTYGDNAVVDRSGNDPATRLARMDRLGTQAELIFPTMGLTGFPGMIADPELADAFARAYNRYIAEFCETDVERLHGAMLLSFNHPQLAASQAKWGAEHGLRVAVTNPTPPDDRAWSDPFYDPIWEALAEYHITVAFHEVTTGCPPHALGVQRYARTYQMVYLVTHVVEAMLGMTDLILGGTLHRFPNLRVLLAEAHAAWLPGWLGTMDYTYTTVGMGSPYANKRVGETKLDMAPSDYFRRQCFVTIFPDDAMIQEAAEVGRDTLLLATDWPHPVSDGRATVADFVGRPDLDDQLKEQLMVTNTQRLLDITA